IAGIARHTQRRKTYQIFRQTTLVICPNYCKTANAYQSVGCFYFWACPAATDYQGVPARSQILVCGAIQVCSRAHAAGPGYSLQGHGAGTVRSASGTCPMPFPLLSLTIRFVCKFTFENFGALFSIFKKR